MHSLQHGKPSLVCDLQELYRHLIDDFLVQYCRRLRKKDFTTKTESVSRKRKGKREYLNVSQTRHLMKHLNAFFEVIVGVPRIRIGGRQTLATLINEEALLFAKYLRNEKKNWIPRIVATAFSQLV
jgi:CRISPR/Cas system-associated endonuclease Cas1